MTTKQLIYVDLDDVLCETARAFLGLLETHFGITATFDSIHSFDLGVSFSLGAKDIERLMTLAHDDGVLKYLAAIPGAKRGLETFRSLGYDIAVVTGRPPSTEQATRFWLDAHGMPYQELMFVDKYGREKRDPSYKRALALDDLRHMSFVCAIEDSWDTAVFLAEQMALPVFLLDRPWNRTNQHLRHKFTRTIHRSADWSEIRSGRLAL